MLPVKILIHEHKLVGGTHCITHLMQSTTQDLNFGNLIHSILHLHSMFAQACVFAAFKKEDKMPNLFKYGVFAAAVLLGQGLLQFGTNAHAEEESEEPRGGIWIIAASCDLPEESTVFGMHLLLPQGLFYSFTLGSHPDMS